MKLFTILVLCSVPGFLRPAFSQNTQPDPRQRARTAHDLVKQGTDGIPSLIPYLSDADLNVRLEAVKSLDDIGGPKTVDALVQAARDNDPEIQIRAADGLVNVYLPGYIKTGITGTLKRAGNAVKVKFPDANDQIIEGFVDVRPEVIQVLGRQTRGGASLECRANAARALGVLRGQAAVPDLTEALHSKDTQLMYEALVALQKIRDPAAGPAIGALVRDLEEKVQIAALQAVGIFRTQEAAPEVRKALERASNSRVRREALTALAMIADPADHPLFVRYLADKDDGLRAAAAEGIARLKNPVDRQHMEEMFTAEHGLSPRLSIAFAVVGLGNREVSEFSPLQYLVNNLNSKVYRPTAMAFLTELARDLSLRQAIYPQLKSATKDEKTGLSIVFARSGDQDSEPYLETLQKDPDPDVMQEGMRSLRTLRARLP